MMKLNIQLFGEKVITTTLIDLKYDDQTGAKENKSAVGIKAYFKAASSSTWFNKKNIYFYCKIVHPNGTETDMQPLNWDNTPKARTVQCSLSEGGNVSKDFYFYFVPHEPDGSLKVRCYWEINTGTSGLGNITESQTQVTQVMASIPRASFPTVSSSSVAMGSSVTINTNRASTSFTHTIRYAFGNTSGTIATGVGDSTSWTPALTLAQQIPGGTSGSGTIYCDTYSNGNLIGTNSVGITLTVPASVKPTISIGTPSETNATMISLNWGVFVQGKSQLSIPITASGSQGSWITGTTTTVNGASYSGTSITTGIINASGSVTISSTTTDSRSRTASASKTATFVSYSNPQITTATAVRCLSDGTEDDEGTYVKYSFAGSISAVSNHNSHLFRIGYREKGVGSYTYTTVDTANYSINKSDIVLNLNLDTSKSYDIRFEANDTFTSTPIERTIDTGFDLMNFNPSGKSMAIGKVSEAGANVELFEVGMNTEIEGDLSVSGIIDGTIDGTDVWTTFKTLSGNARLNLQQILTAKANNGLAKYNRLGGIDFNDLVEYGSGLYSIYATGHYPSGEAWYQVIQIVMPDANYVQQYASYMFDGKPIWVRTGVNGSYGEWVLISDDYRMSELPVGTWTNGQTLYRRAFDGNLNSNGRLPARINVGGTIVKIEGIVRSVYNNRWVIGSHYPFDNGYDSCFVLGGTEFDIETGGYFANCYWYAIVEYVKE